MGGETGGHEDERGLRTMALERVSEDERAGEVRGRDDKSCVCGSGVWGIPGRSCVCRREVWGAGRAFTTEDFHFILSGMILKSGG